MGIIYLSLKNVEDAEGSVRHRLTILDTSHDIRDMTLDDANGSEQPPIRSKALPAIRARWPVRRVGVA